MKRTPSLDLVVSCTQLFITLLEMTCGVLMTLLLVILNLRMQGSPSLSGRQASVTAWTLGMLCLTARCFLPDRTPDGGIHIDVAVVGSMDPRNVTSLCSEVMIVP